VGDETEGGKEKKREKKKGENVNNSVKTNVTKEWRESPAGGGEEEVKRGFKENPAVPTGSHSEWGARESKIEQKSGRNNDAVPKTVRFINSSRR